MGFGNGCNDSNQSNDQIGEKEMENYGMFFAGMLTMASLGGLIAFLIIRPWTRPMRRDWEASHEVIAENSRLQAAQVRRQTVEAQAENDQLEIERRMALRRAGVDPDVPPSWKIKRQYIIGLIATLALFIVLTVIKIYFSK